MQQVLALPPGQVGQIQVWASRQAGGLFGEGQIERVVLGAAPGERQEGRGALALYAHSYF